MQDSEIKKIADDANLIVAGYAYTVSNGNIKCSILKTLTRQQFSALMEI